MKTIDIVPYNSDWRKLFTIEATKIKAALGKECLAIHHIGSTAVLGLVAKPKLDMIAVVKELVQTIAPLKLIDFQYKGEYNIPMHYSFSKCGEININLHVYEEGHPEIELNLCFRDYLRRNAATCSEYATLKQELLLSNIASNKCNGMFSAYTLNKDSFIRNILNQVGFNRLRFLRCAHYAEWNVAKHFRQKYFFDKVPISDPYEWTFNHPDHEHIVLCQGTEVIGYAHIQLWKEYRAAIRIIVIDELKRNKGFGKYFLGLIERWLKLRVYKSIHIESSLEALQFYKSQGYEEMPFNDPDNHESDIRDIAVGKQL